MHHDRRLLTSASLYLLLHIWPVLDVLSEMANVASDFLVRLERERNDGDEAKGEPFPAFHYLRKYVSTGFEKGHLWFEEDISALWSGKMDRGRKGDVRDRRSYRNSGIALLCARHRRGQS